MIIGTKGLKDRWSTQICYLYILMASRDRNQETPRDLPGPMASDKIATEVLSSPDPAGIMYRINIIVRELI